MAVIALVESKVANSTYLKTKRFSLFFDDWAYFDVPDYYADNLFIKHKCPVIFGKEFQRPNDKYRIILCSTPKVFRKRFRAAMRELPNIMVLNGNGDYEDYCIGEIEKIGEENAKKNAAKP